MKKIIINIFNVLPSTLTKDLMDDEMLCNHCSGVGFILGDMPFDVSEDMKKRYPHINIGSSPFKYGKTSYFPFNKQYLHQCPHCYGGVQHFCPHCRTPYQNRSSRECDCEEYQNEKREKERKKSKLTYCKAIKISLQEAIKQGITMLYDDTRDKFVDADEVYDYLLEATEDTIDIHLKDMTFMFYATSTEAISFDVDNILENACDYLFDDVESRLQDVDELRELLDAWAEKNKECSTTYVPNYKIVVMVDMKDVLKDGDVSATTNNR